MNWRTQFSEEAFLHATFSEFVKCWGSGKRARIFVESMNGGAFVNFSTFLGNPGMVHTNQRKMAAKTNRHPGGNHDNQSNFHSGSAPTSSRKKSKRKTERDNKRAAEFQKKKAEEAEREASAATAIPSKEKEARKAKEVAPTAKEEVVPNAKEVPVDDENTANENTAESSNGARVSVINVEDKTPCDKIHSMRNVSKYSFSFHDTSDTDSEALLNVDGNESIKDPEEANAPTRQYLSTSRITTKNHHTCRDGRFPLFHRYQTPEDIECLSCRESFKRNSLFYSFSAAKNEED